MLRHSPTLENYPSCVFQCANTDLLGQWSWAVASRERPVNRILISLDNARGQQVIDVSGGVHPRKSGGALRVAAYAPPPNRSSPEARRCSSKPRASAPPSSAVASERLAAGWRRSEHASGYGSRSTDRGAGRRRAAGHHWSAGSDRRPPRSAVRVVSMALTSVKNSRCNYAC